MQNDKAKGANDRYKKKKKKKRIVQNHWETETRDINEQTNRQQKVLINEAVKTFTAAPKTFRATIKKTR